ncbi:Putative amidoligase enzyme [uncultured Ruminococcus sp.]|nr:Putative amidoligase enzyme [uncultured Clostridium sp.]SCH60826.1 Putative amidoligase enzyme [uncultured Ruminococcus sp.]
MTGITRHQAAQAVASLFGTTAVHCQSSSTYDPWEVFDCDRKKWRFVYDSSIRATRRDGRRQIPVSSGIYKVEMNSPKLSYSEMEKLQTVVRALRRAGAVVNESCGLHVHVDASKHTPQSLKNALSIMYSKEDILFKALNVNEDRVERWCKKVREPMLEKIRKLPTNTTMERLKREWYAGMDGSSEHYNWTRYYALNLHSVFYRGTLEWRCFESTLHAGKVRANITLALAISAQAVNQKRTVMRKTEISENPAFTFRTFLLRLGLIGPEYKNVREHLLKNLPGDRAWRYDRSQYPSLQNRRDQER